MKSVAIIGAGPLGRILAMDLRQHHVPVQLWDPHPKTGEGSTGYMAGGMLAPYSEREKTEPFNFFLGELSLGLWPQVAKDFALSDSYQEHGSLIVAHPRDAGIYREVKSKICRHLPESKFSLGPARKWEESISPSFPEALYLPKEAHLDPRDFFAKSFDSLTRAGVQWQPESLENNQIHQAGWRENFQAIVDCRGYGAQSDLEDLRGVRGEAMIVRAPEVRLRCPVRVMHPRYSLYVVPRSEGCYYLGATQVESADEGPITIRSSLELLSAAYALDPNFAEGQILESCHGLRPAFFHHEPRIRLGDGIIHANGLYRHGFLLAPILSQTLRQVILGQKIDPKLASLIEEIYDERHHQRTSNSAPRELHHQPDA